MSQDREQNPAIACLSAFLWEPLKVSEVKHYVLYCATLKECQFVSNRIILGWRKATEVWRSTEKVFHLCRQQPKGKSDIGLSDMFREVLSPRPLENRRLYVNWMWLTCILSGSIIPIPTAPQLNGIAKRSLAWEEYWILKKKRLRCGVWVCCTWNTVREWGQADKSWTEGHEILIQGSEDMYRIEARGNFSKTGRE